MKCQKPDREGGQFAIEGTQQVDVMSNHNYNCLIVFDRSVIDVLRRIL